MSTIDVSELPEANWPLVGALVVIAAVVIWVIYYIVNGSGAPQITQSASGAAAAAINAGTGAIDQLTGQGAGDPSSGTSFWDGINNVLDHGSIYPSQ